MEGNGNIIQQLANNKEAFILFLSAGFGFLAGRTIRAVLKVIAYIAGAVALVLGVLQYFGIIYIVINFDFLAEIFRSLFAQTNKIGVMEHLFFWVPFVYGFRNRKVVAVP